MKDRRKQRQEHAASMMSPRQAKRLLAGQMESKPSDYRITVSDDDAARRRAWHRIEDIAMARELGLAIEDVA